MICGIFSSAFPAWGKKKANVERMIKKVNNLFMANPPFFIF
jgi:hypothetical protein